MIVIMNLLMTISQGRGQSSEVRLEFVRAKFEHSLAPASPISILSSHSPPYELEEVKIGLATRGYK